jgi:hypothetical protein
VERPRRLLSGARPAAALLVVALVAAACTSGDSAAERVADAGVTTTSAVVATAPLETTEPPKFQIEGTVDDGAFVVAELAEDEARLTGRKVADPTVLERPVLAVKIDNIDTARPQAGIVEADLVFEELVEGGLTRLLAVFQSTDPEVVGPVRSARSTDVPLLMPLTMPLFAWSGSNAAFAELLDDTKIIDVGVDRRPEAYVRRGDRDPPSNLYSSPETLRGYTPDTALTPRQRFDFLDPEVSVAPGSSEVAGVDVDWGTTLVEFRWEELEGGWARTQNGTPHVDEAGVVVAPENLIVQFVPYIDTDAVDSNGAPVPIAQITDGQGTAWIFSGGSVVQGGWFKANVTIPTVFLDLAGERVPLARGRTWILLVPEDRATLIDP